MATNPVRTNLIFNGTDFDVSDEDEKELLEYANKKSFVCFAWGAWCTAYARQQLEKAIRLCGHKFVYCDTDSVKFIGDVDFTGLNAELQALSAKHNAYADDKHGNRRYLGVFEKDSYAKKFCTLGSKKYVYTDEDDQLHITIAGVNKESGAKELGCIENFQEGFIFKESAGMEAVYNDTVLPEPLRIDGHELEVTPNIYLHDSEYTLGLTMEYKTIFRLSQEQFDKIAKTR